MGRPFVEFVDDGQPKFVCTKCRCDVTSEDALIWEGYMGASVPALLFRRAVNVEVCGSKREERLSTGLYMLVDVRCRGCSTVLGWRYLQADRPDQRYKEGMVLLEQAALQHIQNPAEWEQLPLPLLGS